MGSRSQGASTPAHVPREFSAYEPDWDPSTVDLDAYLARIGYPGPRTPTLETLRAVHRAHAASIPFENIDVALGRGVRTGLADVEDKLVRRRRGGYCFEQNPLLAAVLTRLGFQVWRGGARGPMGPEQNSPIRYGCGHAMVVAAAADQTYLCDVGVGYLGASVPVPLIDGAEFGDGGWRYRTDRVTAGADFAGWLLGIETAGGWSNVYAFSEQRFYAADYSDQNFIATDHPESPFAAQLIVQRTGDGARWSLRNLTLSRRLPGAKPTVTDIEPGELRDLLRGTFGLLLDDDTAAAITEFAATARSAGPR